MNTEIPSTLIQRLATPVERPQPSRSPRLHRHPAGRRILAQDVRLRRPRLSGRRRLHGPGQLGNRPRRRRPVRLHAAQRDHDLEPDGDPAAGARRRASASPAAAIWRRPAATATPARSTIVLWLLCEVAIAACDLAEVIGAAIALNLLFGLPLIWGVCLTALDVLIVLFLQHRGFRYVEALVVALIALIAGSFAVELWLARPDARRRRARASSRAPRSCATPTCSTSRSASSARR